MPFRYTNPTTGKHFVAPRKLTDPELEELFKDDTPPISAKKDNSRELGLVDLIPVPDKYKPTFVRVAGTIASGFAGVPFLGAAASELAAEGVEESLGYRKRINPLEIGVAGIGGKFAPGLSGSVAGGIAKGAVFGVGSVTLNALARGEDIPTSGQLAFGALTGAVLTGGGRRFLRSSLYEISTKDVAEETHAILSGEPMRDASEATREGANEVKELQKQLKLSGIKFRPAKKLPSTYRTRIGRFASLNPKETEPVIEEREQVQRELFPESPVGRPKFKQDFSAMRRFHFAPPKYWFDYVQRKTGLPIYRDVFEPVDRAYSRKLTFDARHSEDLGEAFKGLSFRQREKYQAWLESPDKLEAQRLLSLDHGDVRRLTEIQGVYNRTFQAFGLNSERFLTEYLPRLRRAGEQLGHNAQPADIIKTAFPTELPKEVEFFKDAMLRETISPRDTDALAISLGHIREGSYKQFVDPISKRARITYVGNEFDRRLPDHIRLPIDHFLHQVRGDSDLLGRDMAVIFSNMANKMGFKGMTPRLAREHINTLIAAQYGSTLGARPGPIIRNSLQTWQTGYAELGRYWFTGVARALTRDGFDQAERLGLLEGEPGAAQELGEIARQARARGVGGKIEAGVVNLSQRMLSRYQRVDDYNRAIMGLGQWSRAQRAIRLAQGNTARFLDMAFIDALPESEAASIKQIARSGNFQEAARRSAIAFADNTQWVYRAGNRPPAFTGTAGRALGGFGTWASFYKNYLGRMLPKGSGGHKGVRLARFLAANAVLIGAAGVMGEAAGIPGPWRGPLSWNLLGPLSYTGSPLAQTGADALYGFQELTTGRIGAEYQKKTAYDLANFVPGAGLAKDFVHLVKADRGPAEAVGRAVGIYPRLPR